MKFNAIVTISALLNNSTAYSVQDMLSYFSPIESDSKDLTVQEIGKLHPDKNETGEQYDPENEDPAYIYDRSHGDDDIRKRHKDMLEWIWTERPDWLPNHEVDDDDLHHIDQNHIVDHDFRLSFQQIATDNGYRYEAHNVTTDDGYILTMFRVRHQETPDGAPAILLQHGLIDTADCWIMNHADETPGFVLANEGYDVWFGNSRGNRNSRAHVSLNISIPEEKAQFYDYSWKEMGDFDAPAQIDFIRNMTALEKITFIGHNMGNTQMFYALSGEDQMQYKDKLNLFIALAPLTKMDHTKSKLLISLDKHYDWISWWIDYRDWHELFGWMWLEIFKIVCGVDVAWCTWGETFLVTTDSELDDQDRFQVYMGHMPGGGSAKSFLHYAQSISSGKFAQFDYGNSLENRYAYGSDTPPEVNLKRIENTEVPIAMYVGNEDDLADIEDSEWVRDQILDHGYGSDVLVHYEELEAGHSTFLVGLDMRYLESMVKVIGRYNPIPDDIEEIEKDFNQFDLDPILDKYLNHTIPL